MKKANGWGLRTPGEEREIGNRYDHGDRDDGGNNLHEPPPRFRGLGRNLGRLFFLPRRFLFHTRPNLISNDYV